ncbi:MAG: hydantoinase/oxoprolinase family protein [Candidatus Sigynarchaeota archaeon]
MAASTTENVLLLGMDIGGANIKCASIPLKDADQLNKASSTKHFFPLWEKTVHELSAQLARVVDEHVASARNILDNTKTVTIYTCASITGELSDAFSSKKEGIECITSCLSEALVSPKNKRQGFAIMRPRFVTTNGTLLSEDGARSNHRAVSAANWYATAAWVGSFEPDCILIDCGSTTTDIIPIANGKPATKGLTDIERLRHGELVYTGVLRATIPSIAHAVPVHGELIPISFEKFALMADVHLILGNITREQYDCDTADGRPNTIEDSKKRLARIVCEDAAELGDDVILNMARFLAQEQVRMVQNGLEKVTRQYDRTLTCVLTGVGEGFLAMQAARQAGFNKIIPLAEKIGKPSSTVSSALGVLHILASYLKGVGFNGW